MSLGLKRAGFEHLLLVERDQRCIDTLRTNGWDNVLRADVASVDFQPYRGKVDLVAGAPPCQPFSIGGVDGGHRDQRNLFEHAVRCVSECRPRAFLFENVAGLVRPKFASYLDSVVGRLQAMGYLVHAHVVDAAQYGVAQRRVRCLLIGSTTPFTPPPPTSRPLTVRQMMSELGPPDGSNRHVVRVHAARAYKNHLPSRLDQPAKTVLAGTNGPGGGTNCVQLDDGTVRYFTVRELARLQGFPDEYALSPVWTHAVKQLGNAAPPPLICAWATQLSRCL
jgi:DNA (cytosine-5)-methyltransferase 1